MHPKFRLCKLTSPVFGGRFLNAKCSMVFKLKTDTFCYVLGKSWYFTALLHYQVKQGYLFRDTQLLFWTYEQFTADKLQKLWSEKHFNKGLSKNLFVRNTELSEDVFCHLFCADMCKHSRTWITTVGTKARNVKPNFKYCMKDDYKHPHFWGKMFESNVWSTLNIIFLPCQIKLY